VGPNIPFVMQRKACSLICRPCCEPAIFVASNECGTWGHQHDLPWLANPLCLMNDLTGAHVHVTPSRNFCPLRFKKMRNHKTEHDEREHECECAMTHCTCQCHSSACGVNIHTLDLHKHKQCQWEPTKQVVTWLHEQKLGTRRNCWRNAPWSEMSFLVFLDNDVPLLSLNLCTTTNFTCCLLAKRKKEHPITFIMIIFWDLPQRCLQMTLWHWSCCVIFLWTIPLWLTWRVVVVFHFTRSQICAVSYQRLHHALMLSFWAHMAVTCLTCHDEWLMSKMLEVQLAFHEEQVCTCGQLEVQLSQQHGRLWKDLQQPSWQHCKCPHQQAGLFNTSKRCSESNAVSIHCASVPTTLYTLCCTWSFA